MYVSILFTLTGCSTTLTSVPSANVPTPTTTARPEITVEPPRTSTSTSTPILSLNVPSQFSTRAGLALEELADSGSKLMIELDPRETEQDQQDLDFSDITLLPDAEGMLIWEQPIALAVPLTSDWDDLDLDQARALMTQESPFVAVLPWVDLTPDLRALHVDGFHPGDPGYPLTQTWSLHVVERAMTAAQELAPVLQRFLSEDHVIRLAAVGDVMLDRTFRVMLTEGDLDFPFQYLGPQLRQADLAIGNLESALGIGGQPEVKGYTFQAPPEAAISLARAGFDLMTLANNHAMDFGPDQLLQAIQLLADQGIAAVGAGVNEAAAHQPVLREVHGLRVAFLSYVDVPQEYRGFDARVWQATAETAGMAWADVDRIRIDVASARELADLVIVVLHSGYEYVPAPSAEQIGPAHAAIEAGADLVLGHHAHLLQGVEFFGKGVIAYGLGNFAFEDAGPPESGILRIWLDPRGVRSFDLVPVVLDEFGRPHPALPDEAAAIQSLFLERTRALSTLGK